MSWRTVPICEVHWREEEGDREPFRMVADPDLVERCYRCERPTVIYVRRDVSGSSTPDRAD